MNFYTCFHNAIGKKWKRTHKGIPINKPHALLNQLSTIIMRINLVAFFIALACLKTTAAVYGQNISVSVKNAPIEKVFGIIEKQSGYIFWYDKEVLKNANMVSINLSNTKINDALEACFKNQPLSYSITDKTIVVKAKDKTLFERISGFIKSINITGKVLDEQGQPLPGATVRLKGSNTVTTTNLYGQFTITPNNEKDILIITFIGYERLELPAKDNLQVTMIKNSSKLDEVQVIAYGTTTQRINTGSVTKITAADIAKQPVSNPLAVLQGTVPGMTVVQQNGIPGGSFKLLIRGQGTLTANSDPFFIIDGVPFAPNNSNLNTLGSMLSTNADHGLSPFSIINPGDIESIEILKDADATAIYGSRGANGVILITTKKGKAGKTRLNVNVNTGISTPVNLVERMNTEQYLAMRKEAFANDGVTPTVVNAPDLLVYDQSKYTNFNDLMIGKSAIATDLNADLTGGNKNTQFLLSGSYRNENTVYKGNMGNNRMAAHLNLTHSSDDQKFKIIFTTNYATGKTDLVALSPSGASVLSPPNLPDLYDVNGKLSWEYKGVSFSNPLGSLLQTYTSVTDNLLSNLNISYQIAKSLTLRSNMGFNSTQVDELNINPIISQNPLYNPPAFSLFGKNDFKSWIMEPQLNYVIQFGKGKLDALIGGTWQQTRNSTSNVLASGYANDAMLGSMNGAASYTPTSTFYKYRYQAIFARLNYNLFDKYILNLTGRRDGSSRFGPGKQFANFGAIGAAWLFTNEAFLKELSQLSYGKIRVSYGITGNDQIGNYQYLDSWKNTANPYEGTPGLTPSRLFNPDYAWEVNKKLEVALELGFLKDRILFTTAFFKNRSSNQLINYNLPAQTGFTSILRNFPALIENKGLEFGLITKNFNSPYFRWSTSINFTLPKNRLLQFPNIETSAYSSTYVVGESLNVKRGLNYLGVNPQSGLFQFQDQNNDGLLNNKDYVVVGETDPKFFGGINNILTYKNWTLGFLFEFKKQLGVNYLNTIYANLNPGSMLNLPLTFLNRWQNVGDAKELQKLTASTSSEAYKAGINFYSSSGQYSDASFIRLKNVNLSYSLENKWLTKLHLNNLRLFVQGQNLLTITGYKYGDPETQYLNILPPLRTVSFGLQVSL